MATSRLITATARPAPVGTSLVWSPGAAREQPDEAEEEDGTGDDAGDGDDEAAAELERAAEPLGVLALPGGLGDVVDGRQRGHRGSCKACRPPATPVDEKDRQPESDGQRSGGEELGASTERVDHRVDEPTDLEEWQPVGNDGRRNGADGDRPAAAFDASIHGS